jgi:hypothetical protein
MKDQEEKALKGAKRNEKRLKEEAEQLTKDEARRKANLAREQEIGKDLDKRKTRQLEKRAAEEAKRLAKDEARRKDYLAREQAITEAQEARKLRARKQQPE